MTAGSVLISKIWRYTFPADDTVGGAVPSGTVLYTNVRTRMAAEEPTLALLEQGMETPTIFSVAVWPGTLALIHNDELEVTAPPTSPYYGKHYRIIGLQHSSEHPDDPRSHFTLKVRRVEKAHALQ